MYITACALRVGIGTIKINQLCRDPVALSKDGDLLNGFVDIRADQFKLGLSMLDIPAASGGKDSQNNIAHLGDAGHQFNQVCVFDHDHYRGFTRPHLDH